MLDVSLCYRIALYDTFLPLIMTLHLVLLA
jgi:hypothetical protein